MENTKLRQSSRTKKLSTAMRVVDEETRRIVQKNRLDALEGDHLFDEYNYGGLDQEENNYIDVNEGL